MQKQSPINQSIDRSRTADISDLVSPRVKQLSENIGWEVGPGVNKKYSFSLTFKSNKQSIPLVEEILSHAPELPSWELNFGRPPKIWNGRFTLSNKDGETVAVNCTDWTYVLTAFDNNQFFDICLIGNIPRMDKLAKDQACCFIVQAYLGERETLEWVDRIEFTAKPTSGQIDRATPICFLREHILLLKLNDTSQP